MSGVGDIVARLIAAGTPPEVAAVAVAEAFAAGASVTKSTGQSADSAMEKRRAYDRERARIKREIHRTSADSPPTSANGHIDTSSLSSAVQKKESKRRKKVSIPTDWSPTDDALEYATSRGWTADYARSEAQRFHDHFLASGAAKFDWAATWRNWVTSPYQKPPAANGAPTNGKLNVHQAAANLSARLRALDEPAPSDLCDRAGGGSVRRISSG